MSHETEPCFRCQGEHCPVCKGWGSLYTETRQLNQNGDLTRIVYEALRGNWTRPEAGTRNVENARDLARTEAIVAALVPALHKAVAAPPPTATGTGGIAEVEAMARAGAAPPPMPEVVKRRAELRMIAEEMRQDASFWYGPIEEPRNQTLADKLVSWAALCEDAVSDVAAPPPEEAWQAACELRKLTTETVKLLGGTYDTLDDEVCALLLAAAAMLERVAQ
jgi:hypothetical protein